MRRLRYTLLLAFYFCSSQVWGQEQVYLGRSPRALLQGDAFTATADDPYSLFYNPAALGRNKLGLEVSLLNAALGVTNALTEIDRFQDFPSSDPNAITERLLGFPVFLQAGTFPAIKMGPFAFSLYNSTRTSLIIRNATNPVLDVDHRADKGFVFGFGHSFGLNGSRDKVGHGLSLGASVKLIKREGLDGRFDVFGTKLLSIIRDGVEDVSALRDGLGFSEGKAWGVDLGAQYIIRSKFSELSFGLSILDVGGTNFEVTQGTAPLPRQEMFINSGVSWRQDFGLIDYTLSLDLKPLNQDIDFGRRVQMGFELGLPLVTIFSGWNEGYVSYGVGVDIFPFSLTAGFYGVEIGTRFKQEESKRAVVYLSLFDFSFGG